MCSRRASQTGTRFLAWWRGCQAGVSRSCTRRKAAAVGASDKTAFARVAQHECHVRDVREREVNVSSDVIHRRSVEESRSCRRRALGRSRGRSGEPTGQPAQGARVRSARARVRGATTSSRRCPRASGGADSEPCLRLEQRTYSSAQTGQSTRDRTVVEADQPK